MQTNIPIVGEHYIGKIAPDVEIIVINVDENNNTVYAKIIRGDIPHGDPERTIMYMLDNFDFFYELKKTNPTE